MMDGFTKKTITNSRGLGYTYWVRHSSATKPALLLHHGFPDDHELWANIIPYLRDLGHTIVIPDLLGYGETSKPSDPQLYNFKAMAQDMMEILDNEKQRKIISVGHDWGSSLAQRVALFHPERVVGLIILNVAYRPPGEADVKKTNELLVKTTGLPRLAYQEFFTSPHARELLEANLESAFHAFNGSDEGTKNFMEDLLCHDVSTPSKKRG
jgi:pimeloyl-ACP methyl ester carboxylesterase